MVGFIYFFSSASLVELDQHIYNFLQRESFSRLGEIVIDISVFYYNFARKRIEGLKTFANTYVCTPKRSVTPLLLHSLKKFSCTLLQKNKLTKKQQDDE